VPDRARSSPVPPQSFYFSGSARRDPQQPSLADMTRTAIQCLQYNINGYSRRGARLVASAAKQNLTDPRDGNDGTRSGIETAIRYATHALINSPTTTRSAHYRTTHSPMCPFPLRPCAIANQDAAPKSEMIPSALAQRPGGPRTSAVETRGQAACGCRCFSTTPQASPPTARRVSPRSGCRLSPAWMHHGVRLEQLTVLLERRLLLILKELF